MDFHNGVYVQAPFEKIDGETYKELAAKMQKINLMDIVEMDDNTNLQGEVACAGGVCEI